MKYTLKDHIRHAIFGYNTQELRHEVKEELSVLIPQILSEKSTVLYMTLAGFGQVKDEVVRSLIDCGVIMTPISEWERCGYDDCSRAVEFTLPTQGFAYEHTVKTIRELLGVK